MCCSRRDGYTSDLLRSEVVVWWKTVIAGDPEIDVAAIPGRKPAGDLTSVWNSAHAAFREKVANREKIEV